MEIKNEKMKVYIALYHNWYMDATPSRILFFAFDKFEAMAKLVDMFPGLANDHLCWENGELTINDSDENCGSIIVVREVEE